MKKWSTFTHRMIRAIVLSVFVLFIVQSLRTDALIYFVAPRMMLWVKCLAVGMYGLAMHQLYLAIRDVIPSWNKAKVEIQCSCSSHQHHHHHNVLSALITYGALMISLVLTFIFPNQALGSQMAAQKGLNLNPSSILVDARGKTEALLPGTNADFPSNESTQPYAKLAAEMYNKQVISISEDLYIESLTSLDLYKSRFVGKKVELKGYVYRVDGMGENQFAIGRFSMRCCVADTIPLAVMAELDQAKQWKDDTYVVALGEMALRQFNGKSVPTMVIKSIEEITTELPSNPYVHQNPYFGT